MKNESFEARKDSAQSIGKGFPRDGVKQTDIGIKSIQMKDRDGGKHGTGMPDPKGKQ